MQIKIMAEQIGHLRIPFFISVAGLVVSLFWTGLLRFSPSGLEYLSSLSGECPLSRSLQPRDVALLCKFLGTAELVVAFSLFAGLFVPEMGVWGALVLILIILASIVFHLSLPFPLVRAQGYWLPTTDGVRLFQQLMVLGDTCFVLFYYNRSSKEHMQ
jgi:uncharacterized membrane protein YkgB